MSASGEDEAVALPPAPTAMDPTAVPASQRPTGPGAPAAEAGTSLGFVRPTQAGCHALFHVAASSSSPGATEPPAPAAATNAQPPPESSGHPSRRMDTDMEAVECDDGAADGVTVARTEAASPPPDGPAGRCMRQTRLCGASAPQPIDPAGRWDEVDVFARAHAPSSHPHYLSAWLRTWSQAHGVVLRVAEEACLALRGGPTVVVQARYVVHAPSTGPRPGPGRPAEPWRLRPARPAEATPSVRVLYGSHRPSGPPERDPVYGPALAGALSDLTDAEHAVAQRGQPALADLNVSETLYEAVLAAWGEGGGPGRAALPDGPCPDDRLRGRLVLAALRTLTDGGAPVRVSEVLRALAGRRSPRPVTQLVGTVLRGPAFRPSVGPGEWRDGAHHYPPVACIQAVRRVCAALRHAGGAEWPSLAYTHPSCGTNPFSV